VEKANENGRKFMKIIFLGTSSGTPSLRRNVSSIALVFQKKNRLWLWDCGEGTQHQILKTTLKMSKIEKIFISHLHGDHSFGLPGLLASRGLVCGKNQQKIQIIGPEGLDTYLKETLKLSKTYIPYEINIKIIPTNIPSGVIYEDEEYRVNYTELLHNIKTYGYSLEEKKKHKHFLLKKAQICNIQPGPTYKALKEGKTVTLSDGRIFEGKDFVDCIRKGRKVVFGSDTTISKNLIFLAKNADLLIHESTFSCKDKENAQRNFHSTTTIAASVAKEAEVKKLILTHISKRYEKISKNNKTTEKDLLLEAQKIFPHTLLAEDFMEYVV